MRLHLAHPKLQKLLEVIEEVTRDHYENQDATSSCPSKVAKVTGDHYDNQDATSSCTSKVAKVTGGHYNQQHPLHLTRTNLFEGFARCNTHHLKENRNGILKWSRTHTN
ncbi:hypothetical protein Q3G72_004544 [Acer saccharum]|nr:hypothetical protein Q3G72_004544 [Acer saccharum]